MRFYKLRVTANAASIASTFNEQFKPEVIPETNDPFRVHWVHSSDEEFIIGEKVTPTGFEPFHYINSSLNDRF